MKSITFNFVLALSLSHLIGSMSHAGYVNGYFRKDGTYVSGHYKSDPNGTTADNYSTYRNSNPYGKQRDRNPYDPYSTTDDDSDTNDY